MQQIAMGGVNLNDVEPARSERRAASTNACTTPPISSMVSARGTGRTGVGDSRRSHRRPALVSGLDVAFWLAGEAAIHRGIASGVGQLDRHRGTLAVAELDDPVHTACCSSFHMPVSCGVVSPSGATAADSVMISPDPPCARAPRCTRCQRRPLPSPCADT